MTGSVADKIPPRDNKGAPRAISSVRLNLGKDLEANSALPLVMLWSLTSLLTGFGLLMVLSSSSIISFVEEQGFFGGFARQAIYTLIGIPLMIFAARMPIAFWKKLAWIFLGVGILLQLLVFTPLGIEEWGNRNWLRLGPISMQPSEFLKIALIVWMGTVLLVKEKLIHRTIHALIPAIIPGAALALGLVLLGQDLGTAMVMFAIVIAVMFFAEADWKAILLVILVSATVAIFLLVTSPNRMRRLFGLIGEGEDYSGHDWQPLHGIWALAGGGLFGSGLGGSKAKWSWLPAADNDYIFAIIGEEFGLIGTIAVILIYVLLAFAMVRAMRIARDRFGRAVIGGVMVWIVGQAFLNIAVVVRLLPVIGVPLPFISSGGTALIANLIAMGIVISITRDGLEARRIQNHLHRKKARKA
ncbi:MAG TPA: putative lipid II flippase FtsW [Microbacteriaceae bacterium]|nr:putative lipid II flippase FtsW [Microbacteriaceae bacterium]